MPESPGARTHAGARSRVACAGPTGASLRTGGFRTLATVALILLLGAAAPATAQGSASADAAPADATLRDAALPGPELFDVAWDDLDDLVVDLQPAFVPEARTHADAPIYHLDWVLASPTRLTGRVEIRVVNRSSDDWTSLWFHLLPNLLGGAIEVADVRVDGASATPTYEDEGVRMALPLPEPLAPGGARVVAMDVAVSVPSGQQRNYSLLAHRREIVSLAHAYPILAVYRDGVGWDVDPTAEHGDLVFAEASWFRARIEAPSAFELVASGVETEASDAGSAARGARVWQVRAGPVRDLYVSLGPYEVATESVGGITVRSHYLAGRERAARAALDHSLHALEVLGARWTPYPYRSFDVVPLATQALGVEFPGIIALSDRLYDGGSGDLPWVVVHEVAHQWFYGVVGNDQITHPWIDEAMAQYAVLVYARERYGAAEADGVRRAFAQRWRRTDADVPIGFPVTGYSEAEYGSVVYGRGPLVVAQLADAVGAEAFDAFVRGYAAALRWSIATPGSFQTGVEAACGCSFSDLFDEAVLPPSR